MTALAAVMALTALPAEAFAQNERGNANRAERVQRGGGGDFRANRSMNRSMERAPQAQRQSDFRARQMEQRPTMPQRTQNWNERRNAQVPNATADRMERRNDWRQSTNNRTIEQRRNERPSIYRDRAINNARDRDNNVNRDRDNTWNRDRNNNWNRDRNSDVNRDRNNNWNRDRDRDRNWNRDRNTNWSRDRDRDWNRDRNNNWNRDRNSNWNRDRVGRHDSRQWDRRWRDNSRYNWRSYRDSHRHVYRVGRYYSPYNSWSYRRLSIGFFLDSLFYSNRYWINDPWQYRLPMADGPYRWVRYYDDVLLVNIYTGEVVDVINDFFW
ncbi:RcnB family protein [Caenibius sp. WL]|uniref:RcnB family protein n=1 Tax=Caenibius sp. WL TaxID=2872646 RepID=UPI001C994F79|nr:RcnB family protein [Caenibius sp. WL]QZP09638.1 RcnB family protein [Caenibius sp. WL]